MRLCPPSLPQSLINKFLLLVLCFLLPVYTLPVYAQTEDNNKALLQMDVSGFADKALLNKAIIIDEML